MPDISLLGVPISLHCLRTRQPSAGPIGDLPRAQSRMGKGEEWIEGGKPGKRMSTSPLWQMEVGLGQLEESAAAWPSENAAPTPADRGSTCRQRPGLVLEGERSRTRSTETALVLGVRPPWLFHDYEGQAAFYRWEIYVAPRRPSLIHILLGCYKVFCL